MGNSDAASVGTHTSAKSLGCNSVDNSVGTHDTWGSAQGSAAHAPGASDNSSSGAPKAKPRRSMTEIMGFASMSLGASSSSNSNSPQAIGSGPPGLEFVNNTMKAITKW
mmetsp:Transcript_3018/g.6857  ORF Transcript_3018/g.6857 Transcript_3018/m.6857 type:complete len:109 (+) Transcript_3018:1227-1553(+)